jgi:hypothetical protein
MTYDEAMKWLDARGGSITTWDANGGVHVLASAEKMSVAITANDGTDAAEVRRCVVDAVRHLKGMVRG